MTTGMIRPTFSERVIAALLGIVFGCLIGFMLAWMVGVFSATLGAGTLKVSPAQWAFGGGAILGAAGALFGSAAGSFVGYAVSGIFEFERLDRPLTWRLALLSVLGGVGLYLWNKGVFGT